LRFAAKTDLLASPADSLPCHAAMPVATPPHPPLVFIRHGETAWNAVGRLQGQQEIDINARGRAQAERCGRILTRMPGATNLPFIASPMKRTIETMRLVRAAAGLDPDAFSVDERLKEISFGRWEGLTWREVKRDDPRGALRREADKWGCVPPEGESYAMLCERVATWLAELAGPSVVVAHGGVARALMVLIGSEDPLRAAKVEVRQGSVLLFEQGRYRWVG